VIEKRQRVLSKATAGKLLGVSARTVGRLIAARELDAVTVGSRSRRVLLASVDQYLARQCQREMARRVTAERRGAEI
jgi:excisionase family DNA binding protein